MLRERSVNRIRDAARRMHEMIHNLLDYTQARAGAGLSVNPEPARIGEVLRTVTEDCAAAYPGREVSVTGEGDGEGTWDVARLQQLVANLVTNALKHGRLDAPVRLRWRGDVDRLWVEVENEGDPIPEAARSRIFEPLSQLGAGATAGRSGIGLGLFIAREIARAHGGTITLRSGGSTTVFCVELPRATRRAARVGVGRR